MTFRVYCLISPEYNQEQETQLENNYGFNCSCSRCEEDEIDDKFLQSYVCEKYTCGGLLIPNGNQPRICNKCFTLENKE